MGETHSCPLPKITRVREFVFPARSVFLWHVVFLRRDHETILLVLFFQDSRKFVSRSNVHENFRKPKRQATGGVHVIRCTEQNQSINPSLSNILLLSLAGMKLFDTIEHTSDQIVLTRAISVPMRCHRTKPRSFLTAV